MNFNNLNTAKHGLTIIIFFISSIAFGQENLIRNGSFDGVTGDVFPQYWMVCHGEIWNDPTCANFRGEILPIHGHTFMYLRARGINYNDLADALHPRSTREYLIQRLEKPLKKYTNYNFKVFLSFVKEDNFIDFIEPGVAYPMKLEIWAGNDSCIQDKLLKTTPIIDSETWTEQTFTFNTLSEPYQYFKLILQWDESMREAYNGNMMLDNARLVEDDCVIDSAIVTIPFFGDSLTEFDVPAGDSYEWFPEELFTNSKIKSPKLISYTPRCSVVVKTTGKCPFVKIFNLKLNCDNKYSNDIIDTTTVYYRNDKKVFLNALKGRYYKWDYSEYLSSLTVQSPYLTGYADKFVVTVIDNYNCSFKQVFELKISCDSLSLEKEKVVLDTIVAEGTKVTLTPKYGIINGNWQPSTFLECNSCLTTNAYPKLNTEYRIEVLDGFSCPYTEVFKIKIQYFVPNFISPNGDGHNDCLHIAALPENTGLKIFDKSGKLIFSIYPYDNDNKCWTGIDNEGRLVDSGTYWYLIECPGPKTVQKGFVFLKR